ncbi:hypothetical protein B0T25DRAFT_518919 [Lasiosphaeria hispida]|uniref:Uncharacterized protein n=1 Tax=Lasiosphaeria hispida TaxID=260671 RepID=A0AAJ0HJV3_9PEZI|nr:hypothetical protein B0T25DRAFT_518919 [Lasiosphaeria hispida]
MAQKSHHDDQMLKNLVYASIGQSSRVRDFMISSLSRLRISEAAGSGPIENGWEIIDDDDFTDNEWPGPVPTQTKPKRETEKSKIEEPRVEDPRVEEPKMAEPEAEEPGVEKRRIEKLRVEEPRVEERKIQEPKAEQPKVSKAIEKAKPTLADTTSPKAEKTEDIKVVNKPASRLREDSETKEQTTKKALTQEEVEAKKLVYSQKRRSALCGALGDCKDCGNVKPLATDFMADAIAKG